jgi:hypothetical protein
MAIFQNKQTGFLLAHSGNIHEYDFNVHETYADRMPVIARFTFNPDDRQLYEYDAVKGNLKQIQFDRNLLNKFNEVCK